MALPRIRSAVIFVGDKKVAEISSSQYSHDTQNDRQYGIEGLFGFSEGAQITDCTFDTVVPIGGHQIDMADMVLNNKDVTIGVMVDGKLEKADGIFSGRSYTSDSQRGTQRGNWTFMGGKPQRT